MSRNTRDGRRLNATLRDRLREFLHSRHRFRMLLLRRVAAIALVLLAGVLALRPHPGSARAETSVLVATGDLAAGTELTADDLRTRAVAKELAPEGALNDVGAARGRVLATAVRRGEFLTDVRLVGEASTRITTGDGSRAAVAIRPADPAVAGLIHPGREVDVIAARSGQPEILAERAPVLTVHASSGDGAGGRADVREQVIVVSLPQDRAAAVASAALEKAVTVTLR